MNVAQLLDLLEERGLLAGPLVRSLRSQVDNAEEPVVPQRILRLLVDKGHLTEFQAKKLLREVATSKPPQAEQPSDKSLPEPPDEGELGLVPIEEDQQGLKPLSAADELGLASLENDHPSVTKPAAKARPAKGPAATSPQPQPAKTPQPKPVPPQTKQPAPPPAKQPAKPAGPAKKSSPPQAPGRAPAAESAAPAAPSEPAPPATKAPATPAKTEAAPAKPPAAAASAPAPRRAGTWAGSVK